MAYINDRLCLVPFSDLADCPNTSHHAMGSPHFDLQGKPEFRDPIIVALRGDIVDTDLPRCTALAVSCNTRPYQSYGPVMRKIFEASQPHQHPDVRRSLEGVMEVGHVRVMPPGGLSESAEKLIMGCVSPMTGETNWEILHEVLSNMATEFKKLPWGTTLRMPVIGTGASRRGNTAEQTFLETVDKIIDYFDQILLPPQVHLAPRKLLLVHPFPDQSRYIATKLAEEAMFLTILDKMGLYTTDPRVVYGLAHGEKKENQFVTEESFRDAVTHYDEALDHLLKGELDQALKAGARGAEAEPGLRGMYNYLCTFADSNQGLARAIVSKATDLVKQGRLRDAFCVGQALAQIEGGERYQSFADSLRAGYMKSCIAAMEARLLYEKYSETENLVQAIYRGETISMAGHTGEISLDRSTVKKKLLGNLDPLKELESKIPARVVENTYHIVVRKLMADQLELIGARRALDNLAELDKLEIVELTDEHRKTTSQLSGIIDRLEREKDREDRGKLRKQIMEELVQLLPQHGTMRLEAGRFYLTHPEGGVRRNLTRAELSQAWEHFVEGQKHRPRDHGLLAYLGMVILLQGGKFMAGAEEFYRYMIAALDDEIEKGRFSPVTLTPPGGETASAPFADDLTRQAHDYYVEYRKVAQAHVDLIGKIRQSQVSGALNHYREVIEGFTNVGRYDLKLLYEGLMGEEWVNLLCRHQKSIGSIPTPFGEISLDFLFIIYRKIKYWWKYRKLQSAQLQEKMSRLIEQLGKKIQS